MLLSVIRRMKMMMMSIMHISLSSLSGVSSARILQCTTRTIVTSVTKHSTRWNNGSQSSAVHPARSLSESICKCWR